MNQDNLNKKDDQENLNKSDLYEFENDEFINQINE
jgi:hypothetical protein